MTHNDPDLRVSEFVTIEPRQFVARIKTELLLSTGLFVLLGLSGGSLTVVLADQLAQTELQATNLGLYSNPPERVTFWVIAANNLRAVGLIGLGGFLLGLPSLMSISTNGFLAGTLLANVLTSPKPILGLFSLAPHAFFEFPAIVLAGAAGFKLPVEVSRYLCGTDEHLLTYLELIDYGRLCAISLVLVLVSACIEATVTKWLLGAMT